MTIFVILIRQPFELGEKIVAGRPLSAYAEKGISNLPYCITSCINKARIQPADYIAVVYDEMPLVTGEYLVTVANEMKERGIKSIQLNKASLTEYKEFCFEGKGAKHRANSSLTTVVHDAESLVFVTQKLFDRVASRHIKNGVIIKAPDRVYIDDTVSISKGAEIEPFVKLKGSTNIKKGVKVHSYSDIEDSWIGEETEVFSSYIQGAVIGKRCTVGPFAVIRKGSTIGDSVRIGDFVEVKNSVLGDGVKSAHLAYIGDAEVGNSTNIGCGTVFANYDGVKKNRTVIGSEVFIGCNTNLIAPLEIGDNAYIAAGSTVTKDIPQNALCIAREREIIKKDWSNKEK